MLWMGIWVMKIRTKITCGSKIKPASGKNSHLDSLPKRTHIRRLIDVTLPAVIIAPQRNQNLRVLHRVLDRRCTAIVYFLCRLIHLPKRGRHLHIGSIVGIVGEGLYLIKRGIP